MAVVPSGIARRVKPHCLRDLAVRIPDELHAD